MANKCLLNSCPLKSFLLCPAVSGRSMSGLCTASLYLLVVYSWWEWLGANTSLEKLKDKRFCLVSVSSLCCYFLGSILKRLPMCYGFKLGSNLWSQQMWTWWVCGQSLTSLCALRNEAYVISLFNFYITASNHTLDVVQTIMGVDV